MLLKDEFITDVEEAYDYWCTKQDPEQPLPSFDQWITAILQKPVYELLGNKRVENAAR